MTASRGGVGADGSGMGRAQQAALLSATMPTAAGRVGMWDVGGGYPTAPAVDGEERPGSRQLSLSTSAPTLFNARDAGRGAARFVTTSPRTINQAQREID